MELNNNNIDKSLKTPHFKTFTVNEKYLVLVISASVAFLAFSNSFDGEFVHDDIFAIKSNGDVTGKSDLTDLFLNDFWGKRMSTNTSHKSYRPLTTLTFR